MFGRISFVLAAGDRGIARVRPAIYDRPVFLAAIAQSTRDFPSATGPIEPAIEPGGGSEPCNKGEGVITPF